MLRKEAKGLQEVKPTAYANNNSLSILLRLKIFKGCTRASKQKILQLHLDMSFPFLLGLVYSFQMVVYSLTAKRGGERTGEPDKTQAIF